MKAPQASIFERFILSSSQQGALSEAKSNSTHWKNHNHYKFKYSIKKSTNRHFKRQSKTSEIGKRSQMGSLNKSNDESTTTKHLFSMKNSFRKFKNAENISKMIESNESNKIFRLHITNQHTVIPRIPMFGNPISTTQVPRTTKSTRKPSLLGATTTTTSTATP